MTHTHKEQSLEKDLQQLKQAMITRNTSVNATITWILTQQNDFVDTISTSKTGKQAIQLIIY